ncbi:MAG TPA: glycosyl hydrolase family 18 protein [Clostridia bacterium]
MMKTLRHKRFSSFLAFAVVLTFLFSISSFAAKPTKDTTSPTVPSNLTAVSVTNSTVSLSWNSSTDNVGVTAYYIYKNNTYLASTTTTTYTAGSLTSSTTYSFYVKAVDARGNISGSSNVITVTTLQPVSPPPVSSTTKIIGYYAGWSAYNGFTPDKVDASKLTHINYAFASVGSDLKIALGDSTIDPSNFSKLNTLKAAYPNLKTIISVGGWEGSGKFSDAALTDASRTAFADSCVTFIKSYGFDGVDIDWEYPVSGGLSTNVYRPEDKQNFTLLLQKMREKFDAQGTLDGKHYILSIAGGAGSSYVNNTELGILQQYLDYGNIMTYDLHGTWDTYTDFNAPLYNNSDSSPQYKISVDTAVKQWLNAGFPAGKLVVGVPFYGYKYDGVTSANNGLYQRYSSGSAVSYASIAANYLNAPGYVRYFHAQSMVPWLFNGSSFISYDDEQSMGSKAQYIKTNGFAGAMIWELSQDPNRVLLNSLYNGL